MIVGSGISAVDECPFNAMDAFLYGGFGQTDECHAGEGAGGDVDFDLYGPGFDAEECKGIEAGEHCWVATGRLSVGVIFAYVVWVFSLHDTSYQVQRRMKSTEQVRDLRVVGTGLWPSEFCRRIRKVKKTAVCRTVAAVRSRSGWGFDSRTLTGG